jgi:Calx-beta domain
VTMDAVSTRTVTVDYGTANRSATAPDDYDAVAGTLAFEPGQTTKTIDVIVHGDGAYESDESFVLNLGNVAAGSLADNQGVATIVNDDAAPTPPPPPPPPAPPPPAPDRTPPGEVTNVRITPGNKTITLTWTNPRDADFQRVVVMRTGAGKAVQNLAVYDGGGRAFTDRGLRNGSLYRYRISTFDRAGNGSAGVPVAALPQAMLYAPLEGAVVTSPPLLRWKPVRRATYYNVQLYLVRRSGQAKALAATKVLSVWPTKTRYKLTQTWRYAGKRYSLVPGRYTWYVFPGLGKRAANKYGNIVGQSTFTVKAKTVTKKRKR